MRKMLIVPAVLAVCAMLAGCVGFVQYAPESMDMQKKSFALSNNEHASVYIFRDGFLGNQIHTDIFVDGKILGKIFGSTYLYIELPPGEHTITSHLIGYASLKLNMKKGETYFIRDVISPGVYNATASLVPIDREAGENAVRSCRLVESVM